jgi:hypothetical protein
VGEGQEICANIRQYYQTDGRAVFRPVSLLMYIRSLRDDAFQPYAADMGEHGRAVIRHMYRLTLSRNRCFSPGA